MRKPKVAGWITCSGQRHRRPSQIRDILEILWISGEKRKVALDCLRREPQILNPKVSAPTALSQFGGEVTKNFASFASDTEQRLPIHPAQHCARTLLLVGITH